MVALNFPDSPSVGTPFGAYVWDGEKWTASTNAPAVILPATIVPIVESGSGFVGTSLKYAREDHVHPDDGGSGGAPASTATPLMDGVAAVGTQEVYAREDHRHPSDTSRALVGHSHVAAHVTDFAEAVDDRVGSLLVAGANITLSYNDAANTLAIASTAVGASFDAMAPTTTKGDIIFHDGDLSGDGKYNVRLPIGPAGYALQPHPTTGVPAWVGFTHGVAGSIVRTWQSKAGERVSVTDFGAVGDGVTPCDAAILAARTVSNYIYFPPGTYRIAASTTWEWYKTFVFEPIAQLSIDGGVTLTIRGNVDINSQYQVFIGAGSVVGIHDVWVEWFGAVGSNASADADRPVNIGAFDRAYECVRGSDAAIGANGRPTIRIGKGIFNLNSTWVIRPRNEHNIRILGSGIYGNGTRLRAWPGSTGQVIMQMSGASSDTDEGGPTTTIEIRDIWFQVDSNPAVPQGTCLKFNAQGDGRWISGTTESIIENCIFSGAQYDILAYRLIKMLFRRCVFSTNAVAGNAWGVQLHGENNGTLTNVFGCDTLRFQNCHWEGVHYDGTVGLALYSESNISAIQLDTCEWLAHRNPVYMEVQAGLMTITPPGGSPYSQWKGIGDVWFTKCQFDGAGNHGIDLRSFGTGIMADIHFIDCYATAVGPYFISGVSENQGNINSVFVHGCWTAGVSGRAVQMYNCASWSVQGNQFTGVSSPDAVIFGQNLHNSIIANNTYGQGGNALTGNSPHFVKLVGCLHVQVHDNNPCERTTSIVVNDDNHSLNQQYGNTDWKMDNQSSVNGSAYLPDGRLMQWGQSGGGVDRTIFFPIQFRSSTTPAVTASLICNSTDSGYMFGCTVDSITTSSFIVRPRYRTPSGGTGVAGEPASWIAMGLA